MKLEDEALQAEIDYMLKMQDWELLELRKSFTTYIKTIDEELMKRNNK